MVIVGVCKLTNLLQTFFQHEEKKLRAQQKRAELFESLHTYWEERPAFMLAAEGKSGIFVEE